MPSIGAGLERVLHALGVQGGGGISDLPTISGSPRKGICTSHPVSIGTVFRLVVSHLLAWAIVANIAGTWGDIITFGDNVRALKGGFQRAMVTGKGDSGILGGDLRGLHGAVRVQFDLGIGGINLKNELEGVRIFRLTVTLDGTISRPFATGNRAGDVGTPGLLDPPVQGAGLNFQTGLLAHTSLFRNGRNGGEERCPQGQGRGRSYSCKKPTRHIKIS